ncbi:MmgE/PrpD family protein [Dactylosporangium roseum]|uniref:MmgE/PrpD family protein n=1 Tax=Dactylosporangium roseum TaxID=47989 RepID=A0ABY5Z1Y1_9ACTN|nr:MmgE/PrpD family protein [Dactylosporangium roseum]UWZ34514.1 MmgE/PrpD family protein [Dactylosporangium roseum]
MTGGFPSTNGLTLVQQLAQFAVAARNTVPVEVATSVRRRLLDVLGLCVAATDLDTSRAALAFVADQGGQPQAHAIGVGRVSAAWAAFGNGVLAHSLDYDDTHLPSILHPSASVVPAALAMAERTGAAGEQVVGAIAAGLEICVRTGMAGYDRDSNNSTFFEHGQHATSICGAVGSAAAAALLLPGADAKTVADAMGIAVSMASGVIEANRTGGTVKRLHCGWAAHSGVVAADLAHRGLTGPPTALEGRFGFYQAFLHGRFNASEISDGLGERWEVPLIFFKPYPANHFTHTAVDAAAALREKGIRPQDIASAHLAVATPTVRTIGEPLEVKQRPETGYQAQFSGPYAVAAGLIGGGGLAVGLEDYTDELARDPFRRELMAKITVGGDPECDAIYPHQFPAILTLRTTDGRELVEKVLANRGGSKRPLTDAELARKFRSNVGRVLPRASVDAAEEAALALGTATGRTVADLMSMFALTP